MLPEVAGHMALVSKTTANELCGPSTFSVSSVPSSAPSPRSSAASFPLTQFLP